MTRRCAHLMPALSVLFGLATTSCTAWSPGMAPASTPSARLTPMASYFDAAQIRRSGATTVWDALRFLAPHQTLAETGPLGARRTPTTGGSGIAGRPAPRVVLDGFVLPELSALRVKPASDVIDIQLLGSADAVMLFGPGYGGGAVVIRTVRGLERRGF